jgi:hypothetical protein
VQPQPAHTVDCRTATLGQAYAAGAIRPGITLGDLRRADGGPPSAFERRHPRRPPLLRRRHARRADREPAERRDDPRG